MSAHRLSELKHGLESTPGTGVAATWKFPMVGASLSFEDAVIRPAYLTGEAGESTLEDTFIADTGATLTIEDTDCSVELLAYQMNTAIKTVLGPSTTFAFTFPTTAINSISYFTWEMVTASQTYEMNYGFYEKFSIHGDTMADNGRVKFNGVVRGRVASAVTKTSGLTLPANIHPLNVNYAALKIDNVGTAAGTAAATTGFLRGFSLDVETGWFPGRYLDGRSAKDFSVAEGGGTGFKYSGTLKCLLSATGVTEIANARAGTGRIVQINLQGASSRSAKLNLPISFTAAPEIGRTVENGLVMVEFPFAGGYSRTTTAQGAEINVTTSGSLTIT